MQPRRLPDGLLEVRLEDETEDDLFLIEVATYPERRVGQQMTDDLLLVYLDRGQLPEAVTLVLRPKGKYRVPRSRNLRSRRGLSSCRAEVARRGIVDDSRGRTSASRRCRPDPVGAAHGFRRPARDDASTVPGSDRTARPAR